MDETTRIAEGIHIKEDYFLHILGKERKKGASSFTSQTPRADLLVIYHSLVRVLQMTPVFVLEEAFYNAYKTTVPRIQITKYCLEAMDEAVKELYA